MKSSKLINNYLKNKNDVNKMLNKKQRNYYVYLLRKSKTNYYANLDEKKVSGNKLFREVIKPSLSDKSCAKEQINTFFGNIVKNLEINQHSNFDPVINNVKDPTLGAIFMAKYLNSSIKSCSFPFGRCDTPTQKRKKKIQKR